MVITRSQARKINDARDLLTVNLSEENNGTDPTQTRPQKTSSFDCDDDDDNDNDDEKENRVHSENGIHRGASSKEEGSRSNQRYKLLLKEAELPHTELLGRGHRVSRELKTLDEEYLRMSIQSRDYQALERDTNTRSREKQNHSHNLAFSNSRYPTRDAARRAMQKLTSTTGLLDDESSNSFELNFRHHPELKDKNVKLKIGSSNDSSSYSEEEEVNTQRKERYNGRLNPFSQRATEERPSSPTNLSRCTRNSGSTSNRVDLWRSKRQRDSSIDSSISNESLREGSIMSLQGRDKRDASSTSSGSEDVPLTEQEMGKAAARAKESTEKNIPINRFMTEAIGVENERKKRRKELNKTYHHLFFSSEDPYPHSGSTIYGTTSGSNETTNGNNNNNNNGSSGATALGDISPLHVDRKTTFASVGGLPEHIVTLREMVILPLLYPQLFASMNMTPPRGVLFVGPPGTGKTLMARALANEGAQFSHQKITFFIRKGADILSKWVGESERQLSLLFQEARRQQPSIIFFDEIDGLAPTRHTKSEQTQAALVSTLLALLDGLDDRGQVIVIGATNRPDTLDPALRRPGRFDRELIFPLPSYAGRRHILSILTDGSLNPDEQGDHILDELAARSEGWSGADLKALCTEAGLYRLRTTFPQLYMTSKRLKISLEDLKVGRSDFLAAFHRVQPSTQREHWHENHKLTGMEDHRTYLFRRVRDGILSAISRYWGTVEKTLLREKRDCGDLREALLDLTSFPIPHTRHPLLLFLHPLPLEISPQERVLNKTEENAESRLLSDSIVSMLIKALPAFRSIFVDMMQIQMNYPVEHAVGPAMANSGESNPTWSFANSSWGNFTHMYYVVSAAKAAGPCLVIFERLDEWLGMFNGESTSPVIGSVTAEVASVSDSEFEERQKRDFLHHLNLFTETEAFLIMPTLQAKLLAQWLECMPLMPHSSITGGCPLAIQKLTTGLLHPKMVVLESSIPRYPLDPDLERFVEYLERVVTLALVPFTSCSLVSISPGQTSGGEEIAPFCTQWKVLEEDTSPPQPSLSIQEIHRYRKEEWDLWRKVDYRRRQLRYVLLKWVSQYINSGKFRLLVSGNLDLNPDHPFFDEWQAHTEGCHIGLENVLEKLENEEYVCLSQFHDDIETITHNVRTFFRSRSQACQKYRAKALELKEMTVLNMYKINRNIVRFCEAHRNVKEPDDSSLPISNPIQHNKSPPNRSIKLPRTPVQTLRVRSMHDEQSEGPKKTAKRKFRIFGARRRRRRRRVAPAPVEKVAPFEEEGNASQLESEDSLDDEIDHINVDALSSIDESGHQSEIPDVVVKQEPIESDPVHAPGEVSEALSSTHVATTTIVTRETEAEEDDSVNKLQSGVVVPIISPISEEVRNMDVPSAAVTPRERVIMMLQKLRIYQLDCIFDITMRLLENSVAIYRSSGSIVTTTPIEVLESLLKQSIEQLN